MARITYSAPEPEHDGLPEEQLHQTGIVPNVPGGTVPSDSDRYLTAIDNTRPPSRGSRLPPHPGTQHGRTVILITHRLGSSCHADRIIVPDAARSSNGLPTTP
jgi:hypothetical protein